MPRKTTRRPTVREIIDALPKLSKRDLQRVIAAAAAEDRKRFAAGCAAHPANRNGGAS